MQRAFVTNLSLLLLLNLLIKPFWILVVEPGVQNEVGNDAYGEYFSLFNFSFLLNILLDFGITNFNNKNIAQNSHLLTKHFSGLFTLKLGLALVYIVATIVIGLVIGYDVRLTKLLLVLGFNQFLISLVLYLRSNLQALHLFKTDALISVLDRIIMISIVAGMLWFGLFTEQMDIMDFVYAQTAGYFLTALIALAAVVRKSDNFRLKWDLPFSLMILKKSFPFAVLILLMTFYNRIDSVMLERLLPNGDETQVVRLKELRALKTEISIDQKAERVVLEKKLENTGAEQAGIYAKAFRILDATNMIAYLFSVLLLPMFSRMLKYKESVEQLVKLAFTLLMTLAVVVVSGCAFYSREIMTLMYGPENIETVITIFPLLMGCFAAISTTYVFGSLLTANGNLRQLNIMALSGMLFNVIVNLLFIEVFELGAKGTAVSSLCTQLLTALVQVAIVQAKFKFKVNWRLIITLFVFIAGVVSIGNICHSYMAGKGDHGWILGFVVMCAASSAWAFVTRFISIKGMFRILKYG
ncbi:MAG TPA: oligosaccharide flippase family protein [Bacteroidia bacterium]|nr:oligosaccharide flippase family protein [Bacteroidia bacterium]